MENLSEYYFNLLEGSDNPSKVLLKFYTELFEVRPSKGLFTMFERLVKLYGRNNVYLSILDISRNQDRDYSKPAYPLFGYLIQKRLQHLKHKNSLKDVTEEIAKFRKEKEEFDKLTLDLPEDIE